MQTISAEGGGQGGAAAQAGPAEEEREDEVHTLRCLGAEVTFRDPGPLRGTVPSSLDRATLKEFGQCWGG